MSTDAVTNQTLDLWSRHAGDAAGFRLAILQQRLRDIVTVAHALLVGMRRAHAIAAVIKKAVDENGGRASQADLPINGVGGELCLHGLEHVVGQDRLMLAAIHLTPVMDLANVEPVLEQMGERPHAKPNPTTLLALPAPIDLGPAATPVEFREQSAHGAKFQIEGENGPDRLGLFGHAFEFF